MEIFVDIGHWVEHLVSVIAPLVTGSLELIGILIVVYGSVTSLIMLVKSGFNFADRSTILNLGEALSLSLQFKLGAEIIKTVVVRNLQEVLILGFIVVLRIALTLLIHWEVEQANKEDNHLTIAALEKDDDK